LAHRRWGPKYIDASTTHWNPGYVFFMELCSC
jgi:hypothetical protein